MVDRCVSKDSSSCDPSRMTQDRRSREMQLGSQREESVLMHLSTTWFFFLCHGFMKFMYINKILMKTRLIFLYYVLQCELLCVPTSGSGFYQWVWIFASGSGFCQWVWIASGSGYENPMHQVPCCIM